MLPDKSILIGQKLSKNAKIEKYKCDILDDFQTMWPPRTLPVNEKWVGTGRGRKKISVISILKDGLIEVGL